MSGTGHNQARCSCSLRASAQGDQSPSLHSSHSRKTHVLWTTTRYSAHPAATPSEARGWTQVLRSYRQPSDGRGIVEIGITLVPLVALWVLIWAALDVGYWLSLLLAVPAAGFLVRLFMIQHDCGHGAFFRHRLVERLGRPRHRRADADALRFLAPHPRAASRHVGQSRSPRLRRHRYADGARISRRCRSWAGCAIACTGIRWSCSASARPICSSCSTGFRSG